MGGSAGPINTPEVDPYLSTTGMGMIRTLGPEGDVKKIWDSKRPDEVADARRSFDDLRAKGYLAFKCDKKGEKGEQISSFDPALEMIIMSPPLRGG